MKILNKKRLRDIKQNKMQFLNIFIMIWLGVFVFTGIHAYMDGMQVSGDKYYKENNLEDLWLSGENFSDEDLKEVKEISNVKDAERVLTIKTELQKDDENNSNSDNNNSNKNTNNSNKSKDKKDNIILETNFIESNNISKMYVVDGESFDKDKKGIWFDSYLAKNLNLKVGDEITLTYQNLKITDKIVGLVNTPDHVYFIKDDTEIFPEHKNYGFVYLSINELPENMPKIFNQILVDVNDTNKLDETKIDIENNIKSAEGVTDRTSSTSYVTYKSEIDEGKTYSVMFTFFFLFIAVLSVVTTMNRFVKKQRTQIGTLKALGFKDSVIIKHYIGYGFIISLIASILGIILGELLIGQGFINMEASYFEIPNCKTAILPIVYILAIAVIVLITFVTYLSCIGILKEPAVESLRLEVPKVKKAKFDFTTKGIFKNASISTKWNLRDIGRNKGRSIVAIVGIIGCTALMSCSLGIMDTMNDYINIEFEDISKFNYKLSFTNDYTDEQLKNVESKYGNETTESLGVELKLGDNKEANTLVVTDAPNKVKTLGHNFEEIGLKDDGIYISEKLSKKYNLNVGDEIEWHVFGDTKWNKSKIVGLNRDPQNQQMTMKRKYYEDLGLKYRATALYTDSDLSDIKTIDGVETIQSKENLKSSVGAMLNVMTTAVALLIVVSVILGVVIIYNLGILSFSEKQYQFATLKVLGFKDKNIKKIFIKQNLWLTILGIIIGLPLGYVILVYIFKSSIGENYDFSAVLSFTSCLYSIIGTLLVSILVNEFLARKIGKIDMVSSLKANE